MKRTLSADKLQMITPHTQERIDRGEISGSVSLVAQDGKLLYAKAQGYANYTRKVPLKTDTIFRLASMTKPIIGVAVMQLEEQGKLSLDGPLSRYIPEFAGLQACESGKLVAVNREIMIRDLLSHSCGLGQEEQGLQYIAENLPIGPNDTLASYVPKLAQVPLDFQPGTKTGYSPMAAFDILARVVEIVSGQTVDHYLRDHIFIPLDMRDTAFVLTGAQKSRLVEMTDHVGGVLTGVSDDEGSFPGDMCSDHYFCGGGGLYSTAEDYHRFAQMLLGAGSYQGGQLLRPETVEKMRTPQLPFDIPGRGPGEIWGLSMRVITGEENPSPHPAAHSFGWSGAWGTHFWVDPDNCLTAVRMINLIDAGGASAITARELEQDVTDALK